VQKADLSNMPVADQHRFALPPHIYGSTSAALAELCQNRDIPVAIVMSGISGSGKTFAAKQVMRFFAYASSAALIDEFGASDVSLTAAPTGALLSGAAATGLDGKLGLVEAMLLHCDTIFSAFGCAKIGGNASSSRYVRETKLYMGRSGIIEDVTLKAIYFDAARVNGFETRADGQRNYNIFYMLAAGLSPTERAACQFTTDSVTSYDALSRGVTLVDGRNERAEFEQLENAFEVFRIDHERRHEIYRALVAILSLSNVEFRGADVPSLDGPAAESLAIAAQLLGIDNVDTLRAQLASKEVGREGNKKKRNRKPSEANLCVEKFVQALYMRLVQHLTLEMETMLKKACRSTWEDRLGASSKKELENELFISVVDTAGFESLSEGTNRFEQLLVNYTAEKFRHLCDDLVIKMPFQLYDAELRDSPVLNGTSVKWSPLFGDARTGEGGRFPWKSNLIALELMEKSLQPIGLLEQVENSAQYTRITTEKLRTDIQAQTGATVPWGQLLTWPRQTFSANLDFGVRHTWGDVTYSVGDAQDMSESLSFIEAGKGEYSTMLRGVKALLADTSSNSFVRSAFSTCATAPGAAPAKSRPTGPPFFAKRFKTSLNAITRSIKLCDVQWIHCIQPNTISMPQFFESAHVASQLRSLGVSQAIRAQQAGYAYAMPYLDFYADNVLSCPQLAKKFGMEPQADILPQLCVQMINILILDMPDLVALPLAGPHAIVQFGATKVFCKDVLVQGLRRVKDRKLLNMNKASIKLQASWKMAKERKRLASLYAGMTKLQAVARGNADRRQVNDQLQSVMRVQEAVAIFISRQNFLLMRDAASRIQSTFKRFLARRSFITQRRMLYVTHWLSRGLLLRCKILRYLEAITLIQRSVRVFLVRHRFRWHQIKAAMLIQSVFRGYGARNHMPEMMEYLQIKKEERYRELLIRSLFATYKAGVMRSRFVQMRSAVMRLQAEFKARYQRRRFLRLLEDVVSCQRIARVYVSKQKLNRLRSAALVLRERWKVSKMREEEVLALSKYSTEVEVSWLKEVVQAGGDASTVAARRVAAASQSKKNAQVAARQNMRMLRKGGGSGGGAIVKHSGNGRVSSTAIEPTLFAKLKVVDIDMTSDTSQIYVGGWVGKLASLEKIVTSKGQSLVQVKVGVHHSMALTDAGECYAWGWGDRGQLGTGSWNNITTPTLVSKLLFSEANKASTTTFISQIECGADHTLALSDIGQLFSWGGGSRGQLGHGAGVDLASPTPIDRFRRRVTAIGCGAFHSVAVTGTGALFVWGGGRLQVGASRGNGGPRGGGNAVAQPSRRLTSEQKLAMEADAMLEKLTRLTLAQLRRELSSRNLSAVGGRRALQKRLRAPLREEASKGRVLRDGDVAIPTAVSTGRSTVVQIAVGSDFTLALDAASQVWGWGANSHGQLGLGDLDPRPQPTMITALILEQDKVVSIAAGSHHAAAATASGALWTWGANEFGQLGLGDTLLRAEPQHVRGERDEIVRLGTSFVSVDCSERQTVAMTEHGDVWSIGGHYGATETVRAEQERGISAMAASALGQASGAPGDRGPTIQLSPHPMVSECQDMVGCSATGLACSYAKGLSTTAVYYTHINMNERTAADAEQRLKQLRSGGSGPARERQVLRTEARRLLADAGAPVTLYASNEADIARNESALYGMAPKLDDNDLEGLSDIELLTLVTQLQDGQGPALRNGNSSSSTVSPRSRISPRSRSVSPRRSPSSTPREQGWNRSTRVASSGGTAAARATAGSASTSSKSTEEDVIELLRQALSPAQWDALSIVDKQALARAHGIHISVIDRLQSDVAEQFNTVASLKRSTSQGRMKRVNAALNSLLRAYRRNGRYAEDCFDHTEDGALAPTEIARGLKRLGIFATTPQLDRLFDALGMSDSDTIDRDALIALLPRDIRGQRRTSPSQQQRRRGGGSAYVLRNGRNRIDVDGLFSRNALQSHVDGSSRSIPSSASGSGRPDVGSGLTVADMLYGDDSTGASRSRQSPTSSRRGDNMVRLFRKHGSSKRNASPRRVVKARGSSRSPGVFNTSPDKRRNLEVQQTMNRELARSRRQQRQFAASKQQQQDLLSSLSAQETLSASYIDELQHFNDAPAAQVHVSRRGSIDISPAISGAGNVPLPPPPPPASLRAPADALYQEYSSSSHSHQPKSSSNVHVSRNGSIMINGRETEYSAANYVGNGGGTAASVNRSEFEPLPSVEKMMAEIRANVSAANRRY
jgi:myosin heavy subunit